MLPPTEKWFVIRKLETPDGETEPRLVAPEIEQNHYEDTVWIDEQFESYTAAKDCLDNYGVDDPRGHTHVDGLIICELTLKPVERYQAPAAGPSQTAP